MRKYTFVATAVLAALVTAAPLAEAQGRNRGNDRGGEARGQRWPSRGDAGGGGGSRQPAQRQAVPRDDGRAQQPRAQQPRAQSDGGRRDGGQRDGGQRDGGGPQIYGQRNGGDRRGDVRRDRNDARPGVNRYAVPRTGPVPRYRDGDRRVYVQPRSNYYVYRYPSYRYGYPRYYGYRYYDPFFAGDFYWSNHAWRARSYYYGGSWNDDLGKLRLDIDQRDAEVYIDGYYAGVIDDFDGRLQGLRLEPGNYQVEVALPGYEPLVFDVHVSPGRTTTYRGSLLPAP